jgi:uncharacterized protein with PIN domain
MLGGLARWLRAAGYDVSWHPGIGDWDLVRLARREGRMLLSSDTGIFRIGIVRDGEVPGLLVPQGLRKTEQLAFVLRALCLDLRPPRCMACGGALVEVSREQVGDRAPARSLAWCDHFSQCSRCGQVFWQGSHWQRIAQLLQDVRGSGPTPGNSTASSL